MIEEEPPSYFAIDGEHARRVVKENKGAVCRLVVFLAAALTSMIRLVSRFVMDTIASFSGGATK